MADFSIDQNNLPGVKEVCRDFAVLEDHCLAHNLQEQEIESHLASNVHKSRLVQQDLRVAKRLQEEEDKRAKAESKKHHQHLERIDNEIAQEIQEQLVRQAEQLRQQEEKDEAIARKLQEREMKERKRQKQPEPNFEDPYYEDQGRRMHREYGMTEATHGLANLDLQDQELIDLEVARRLQEEEIKASQIDKHAAQVAQDEELARRLMEEEKKEYKRSRDKDKHAMEKKRHEMEYKPMQEEVVRPRTREEVYRGEDEYQKPRQNHKPARPPPPPHHYENINPSYAYVESPYSPRPPSRPEAAYKGAYYRQ
ncbi:coiled-coil domain-containing protein 50 isoform X2 [Paramisgurnus dabryanus]|uniref:coiled-coil domain-containing protein 50 isoform X2 n=1 Tax=Paramisgurnus dabryanus TaxID=90735 RepID=UPI0031F3AE3E